jgi:dolichol-phosphate mannosyltransferase
VVDDGSPDGTATLVSDFSLFNKRVFLLNRTKKEGLGKAYLSGFQWALEKHYQYVYEMDADFSHHPKYLASMHQSLSTDCDVIIGSRYAKGVNVVNWPIERVLLSYFASKYVQWILRMPIKDPTSGFIGYRRHVLESLNLKAIKAIGYSFQIEMKFKIWVKGYRLNEHSIIFTDREKGVSKVSGHIIYEAIFGVIGLKIRQWLNKL